MAADVAVVVVALLLSSLVKATLGFGAPLISLPILALGLGSEDAVVLMAIPGVVSNGIMVYTTRSHHHETVDLKAILIPSIPTAAVGALILSELPDRGISVMMAGMLITYLLVRGFRPDATLTPATRRWLAPTIGGMGGLSQGAVGISLPWYGPYLHTLRLTPGAFTHEVCAFFLFPTAVQMTTLAALGEYDARRVGLSILASAVFVMTLPVGSRLRRTMTPKGFETAVLVMLAVAAVALVTEAVIG
jgi:uncharacterized membrane protein YfcA